MVSGRCVLSISNAHIYIIKNISNIILYNMSEETKSIELIDDKPSYVSFRISSEEFKQMECFAKFLHKQGVIKAANSALLSPLYLVHRDKQVRKILTRSSTCSYRTEATGRCN